MNTTTPVLFVTLNFFKKSNLKTTIKKKTNPCFRIWWILGADFLPLVGCEIFFPGKNCREAEYMVFSWQELRWISYPYTQISQSFTSSRCRNPQCALLIHSAWRQSSPFIQLCPSPLRFLVVNFPLRLQTTNSKQNQSESSSSVRHSPVTSPALPAKHCGSRLSSLPEKHSK